MDIILRIEAFQWFNKFKAIKLESGKGIKLSSKQITDTNSCDICKLSYRLIVVEPSKSTAKNTVVHSFKNSTSVKLAIEVFYGTRIYLSIGDTYIDRRHFKKNHLEKSQIFKI